MRETRGDTRNILALAMLITGVGTLSYQIYSWLRYGSWIEVSVRTALAQFHLMPSALRHWAGISTTDQWTGVHILLGWLPLSVVGLVSAFLLALWADQQR
jgi:hypothetical protein